LPFFLLLRGIVEGAKPASIFPFAILTMMTDSKQCPCTSGAPYALCCGPLLSRQARAATAEALMRSRYTAYAERNISYLLQTWHPCTRPSVLDPATIPNWCGLQIVRTERGRKDDDEGLVEFVATALVRNTLCTLHEVSRFVREAGEWLYVAGDLLEDGKPAENRPSKAGRNDPCPCGSGKKFKKCCGR
jgi:SEC-C motif-containing protein